MVKLAEQNDIKELAVILMQYREFYGVNNQNEEEVEEFIRNRMSNEQSKIFVAIEDDKIVGFMQLYPSFSTVSLKPQWILNDLYVKKGYRRKGYGTELMTAVKNYFCDKAKGMILVTEKDNNTAKAFYDHSGWETDVYDFYTFYYSNK